MNGYGGSIGGHWIDEFNWWMEAVGGVEPASRRPFVKKSALVD